MTKISEVLTVAYDSGDKDISCLIVARKENDKFTVLKEFYGTEADVLYNELLKVNGAEE